MSGQLPVAEGGVPVIRGGASGSQGPSKLEFAVAESKAEDLYNILQVARTWSEPFTSVGLALPQSAGMYQLHQLSLRVWEPEALAPDLTA